MNGSRYDLPTQPLSRRLPRLAGPAERFWPLGLARGARSDPLGLVLVEPDAESMTRWLPWLLVGVVGFSPATETTTVIHFCHGSEATAVAEAADAYFQARDDQDREATFAIHRGAAGQLRWEADWIEKQEQAEAILRRALEDWRECR